MKIQGNVIPPKDGNSSNADFKYTKIGTKVDKKFQKFTSKKWPITSKRIQISRLIQSKT